MAKVTRRSPRKPGFRAGWQHRWQRFLKLTNHHPKFIGLLLGVFVLIAFIGFATFLPSSQPFEGSLSLQSLSFISTADQSFLLNTPALKEFTLKGDFPLRLTGKFSGNPALPTPTTQNPITLELSPQADPTWQIRSTDSSTISLADLRLTPQTTIRHLTYDAQNQRLAFDLIPTAPIPLSLQLSGSLTLQLNGYQIKNLPALQTQSDFDLTWQPDNQQVLTLETPIHLELQFVELSDSPFWASIACDRVVLDKPNVRPTNYGDNYRESAILGGTIRLADKSYTLEENQFLKFQPLDSIRTLFRLRLANEKTTVKPNDDQLLKLTQQQPGLQVDISGETRQIMIGMNEKLPVAKLQASFLEAWMPRDAVIALIAFLSTLVMTLISWLWEIATAEPESKNLPNP
jgi:hypothetical protein